MYTVLISEVGAFCVSWITYDQFYIHISVCVGVRIYTQNHEKNDYHHSVIETYGVWFNIVGTTEISSAQQTKQGA